MRNKFIRLAIIASILTLVLAIGLNITHDRKAMLNDKESINSIERDIIKYP
ncbi:hypothetical protein SAMN05444401_3684 [Clostridium amylolyticum]|uniref:Uncharacterized protein n=1 Tax=Clostridium amylolyticum TaxID=1121298 RepID=A0A1M6LKY3_9CLOT|nr:hypothetical protein [Clostridium amylolyticum]SHJ71854.1 hypothetical protein SAMN05444401_3684 [Clostridium amylolyticum]